MKRKSMIPPLFAGLVISATTIVLSACQAPNTVNDSVFVDAADRFVNSTVGPEYEAILAGTFNPSVLTEEEIEDRMQNVRTFRAAVLNAKNELEAVAQP